MVLDDKTLQEIKEAAEIIKNSEYVTCLTGAGISVESGIRPFRGPGGLWTEKGEPSMDGYQRFLRDPEAYWRRRLEESSEFGISIRNSKPNPGHYALAELEKMNVLKYLITQNIDNLHLSAGSTKVLEIHGNGHYLRCLDCSAKWPIDDFIIESIPPRCPNCGGIMKTDSVMFGEPIPVNVLNRCYEESKLSDCMILAGTSATVTPAANLPLIVRRNGGALIEVNIQESQISYNCEVNIFAPSGEAIPELVKELKKLV
jgi:NAD-dependent deacetylase